MRALPPLIAAAAALLAPQAARAATLQELGPCYRSVDVSKRESVPVQASGFTPGDEVEVAVDGTPVARVTALEDGRVEGSVPAPYHAKGQRLFTLSVTQVSQPTNTASTTSRVAALSLRLEPRNAAPSRRVRIRGLGFIDGGVERKMVYAHYVRKSKVRKTIELGPPRGPCGRISARRRQIPVRRPALGLWIMQVDNTPAYTPTPIGVATRWKITVRRSPRPAAAN